MLFASIIFGYCLFQYLIVYIFEYFYPYSPEIAVFAAFSFGLGCIIIAATLYLGKKLNVLIEFKRNEISEFTSLEINNVEIES